MKFLSQSKKFLIAGFVVSTVLFSCTESETKEKTPAKNEVFSNIPPLQERGVALGPNEEMDNIFGQYDKSIKAINKDPFDMEARLTLSEVFITEARITGKHAYNYESALLVLDDVLASKRTNKDQRFRALMNKAAVKLSLHQFQEALTLGNEAVMINNRNAGIFGVLVDAHVELGNYKEAVAMSDRMVAIKPDLRSYSRISYLREIHGDVEGAKEAMNMAVGAGYPGIEATEWARITLGKLCERYGDIRTAEMHYMIALRERPNYPYALAALGNLERKKGNLAKAEELINNATKYINEASFYEDLADVYLAQNFPEKAQSDYQKAIKMMGGSENDKGHSHVDGSYHVHLEDDGSHGHNHGLELANLYLKIGNNLDNALDNARAEYQIRPDNIDVNKSLAMIYYQKGALDLANDHLDKALFTNTKDPDLMSLKGLIEIKNGDTTSGKTYLETAFKSNPYQESVILAEAKKSMTL